MERMGRSFRIRLGTLSGERFSRRDSQPMYGPLRKGSGANMKRGASFESDCLSNLIELSKQGLW